MKLEFNNLICFSHFAMSKRCVFVSIGNDDEDLKLARACAQRLYDVLSHTRMFGGHSVCVDPILLLDKSNEEISQGIKKAVKLAKNRAADWLVIYYAGHSFLNKHREREIVKIKPQAAGRGMNLEKQVKQIVKAHINWAMQTTIFMDGCLVELSEEQRPDEAEDSDEDQLGDSKKLPRNEDFKLVCSCEKREGVKDGSLFVRAIERCAREYFHDQEDLIKHVKELARQLSFGRLCRDSERPDVPGYMVLTTTQVRRGLLEKFYFLPFAFDLQTEDALTLDPQREDKPGPEGLDIDEVVKILREIVKELETKQAAFEKPCCELEAILNSGSSLEGSLKCLKNPETPVRDGPRRQTPVLFEEEVRRAIVGGLHQLGKACRHGLCNKDELNLDLIVQNHVKWHKEVVKLQETESRSGRPNQDQFCDELEIPGRVYLVPGSLWIIFCWALQRSSKEVCNKSQILDRPAEAKWM